MASAVVPGLNPEAGPRRLSLKIEAIFSYVLAFLGKELEGDPDGRRFLAGTPAANGFPGELLTLIDMPPTAH
jgi:hypothetical protein